MAVLFFPLISRVLLALPGFHYGSFSCSLREPADERFRAWRATRHINIYRDNTVYSLYNMVAMLPVRTSTIRAGSHGYNIARLRHLLVKAADAVGHFKCYRPGDDHYISLAGRSARGHAETLHIVNRSACAHKFNGTAGYTERHGEHGREPGPVQEIIEARYNNTTLFKPLIEQTFHLCFAVTLLVYRQFYRHIFHSVSHRARTAPVSSLLWEQAQA